MSEVSIEEATKELTKLIDEVTCGKAVHITRRSKAVALLISAETYERLQSGASTPDFWEAMEQWRTQTRFDWPELTPEEVDSWRDRTAGKEFSWPD